MGSGDIVRIGSTPGLQINGGFNGAVLSGTMILSSVATLGQTILTPAMTSNTEPSGIVSANVTDGTNYAWKAFDQNASTYWCGYPSSTPTITYQFPSAVVVNRYTLQVRNPGNASFPDSWKLQGSNDGSAWTDLDTQTSVALPAEGAILIYNIANTTAYLYYRIYVTAVRSASQADIAEIGLYGPPLSGTVTLDVTEDVYEWLKLYFKTVTPANTTVTCAVKDTSNNVLIASVTDGGDLSGIDTKTYKTLRLVFTLTRVSTSDTTPELHMPFWTWIGSIPQAFDWTAKTPTYARLKTNSNSLQTVIDVTGEGLAYVAIASADTTDRQGRVVLTVDGAVLDDTSSSVLAIKQDEGWRTYGNGGIGEFSPLYDPIGNWGHVRQNAANTGPIGLIPIGFKGSFKYEINTTSGVNIMGVAVVLS